MELGAKKIKGARVLIVDDLRFMRMVLREILEKNGFSVAGEAENGKAALEIYSKVLPDLILLDITMPEMDGLTALKNLILKDPGAKVVMCSSLGQQEYIIRAIQLGAKDFIVKPFTEERVVSALQKAFLR